MMQTSDKGLNLIKKFEGFSEKEYICPAGKATIGYGHVILASEVFTQPMTRNEAENLLKKDLITREIDLNKSLKVPITQNQFDALICLIYNIGITNFKSSTLLKFINEKMFDKAPDQFRRWRYVNKVESKGLLNRREEEIKLWLA